MTTRTSIVLVDDTPDVRLLLRMLLEAEGDFEVVGEGGTGSEAVDLADALRPDAMLLDVAMPEMDGLQALPEILAISPTTRIVMFSGFDAGRIEREAKRLGAKAYVEKGTPPRRLITLLREAFGMDQPPGDAPSRRVELAAAVAIEPLPEDGTLGELLGVLSHELLTPLSVIQGFAQLLRAGHPLTTTTREDALESIDRSARHMHTLIRSFADAHRLEVDNVDLDPVPVDVAALVRELVVDLRALSNRSIDLTGPDRLDAVLDPTRIRQVVSNLITNALKFSAVDRLVSVTVSGDDDIACIEVRDSGPGIDPADHARVFEKFERLESTVGGTGLGLYVSRGLARAHGGDLTVRSELGEGSSFRLAVPRRTVELSSDDPPATVGAPT